MSSRTDAQAGIDIQKSKEGVQDSISPTSQADETFQPILDGARMKDEPLESAIYQRGYSGGSASLFFDFAVNEVYSDSLDINKVSNSQVLLKGGNKYEVRAQLNCTCVFVDGYVDFTIYNVGDNQNLGVQGTCILSDNTGNSGSMIEAVAHLKYNNDVTIEVRKTNGDVITGYNTSVVIKKV